MCIRYMCNTHVTHLQVFDNWSFICPMWRLHQVTIIFSILMPFSPSRYIVSKINKSSQTALIASYFNTVLPIHIKISDKLDIDLCVTYLNFDRCGVCALVSRCKHVILQIAFMKPYNVQSFRSGFTKHTGLSSLQTL